MQIGMKLCSGDNSLCCIKKKGNISDSEEQAQVKAACFAKHIDDNQICKATSEMIPRNTIKSTNLGNNIFKVCALREILIKKLLTSTFLGVCP